MQNSTEKHNRTSILLSTTHPRHRVRYSTNPSQQNWRKGVDGDSDLEGFFTQQTTLQERITTLLREGDTSSEQLLGLFSRYLSNPFDLLGCSVSTPGVIGLQHAKPGLKLDDGFESRLAAAYDVQFARVGSGGTSSLVQTSLKAARRAKPGRRDLVITCGTEHAAFWGACVSTGLKVASLKREVDPVTKLKVFNYEKRLLKKIRKHQNRCLAVFLTLPSYEGGAIELSRIYEECRRQSIYLIIDGAWSGLWSQHPDFPASLAGNCDCLLLSAHKAGLAPCQVSAVLFNDKGLVRAYDELGMLGDVTTSPNQLMLAVAEGRFTDLLEGRFDVGWSRAISARHDLADRLSEIHPDMAYVDMATLGADYWSPNQIVLCTSQIPVDCRLWAKELSERFGRDAEMASQRTLNLIFAPGSCEDLDALLNELRLSLLVAIAESEAIDLGECELLPSGSSAEITAPREIFFGPTDLVDLEEAVGCVASAMITVTPPCRKVCGYGDVIEDSHIKAIQNALRVGTQVYGLEYLSNTPHIRIVADDQPVSITTLKTPIDNPELAFEIAKLLAGGWAAAPYFHAFVHEAKPLESISPARYLNRIHDTDKHTEKSWYSWEDLEAIPIRPGYHRVVNVARYAEELLNRFKDPGYEL